MLVKAWVYSFNICHLIWTYFACQQRSSPHLENVGRCKGKRSGMVGNKGGSTWVNTTGSSGVQTQETFGKVSLSFCLSTLSFSVSSSICQTLLKWLWSPRVTTPPLPLLPFLTCTLKLFNYSDTVLYRVVWQMMSVSAYKCVRACVIETIVLGELYPQRHSWTECVEFQNPSPPAMSTKMICTHAASFISPRRSLHFTPLCPRS